MITFVLKEAVVINLAEASRDVWKEVKKARVLLKEHAGEPAPALMRVIGLDPATDFAWGNFPRITNWGDEDVTGWDFRGSDLSGCDLSTLSNLKNAVFSPETKLDGAILPEGLTIEMLLS